MAIKRSLNKNKGKRNTLNKNKGKRYTLNKNKGKRNTLNKNKRKRNTLNKNKRKRYTFKRGGRKGDIDENILMFVSNIEGKKYITVSYDLNGDDGVLEYPEESYYYLYENIEGNNTVFGENKKSEPLIAPDFVRERSSESSDPKLRLFNPESLNTIKDIIDHRIGENDILTHNNFSVKICDGDHAHVVESVPILLDNGKLRPFKIEKVEAGSECVLKRMKRWGMKWQLTMPHKKILYYDLDDQIMYFNFLFTIICCMKNLGMKTVNIYEKPETFMSQNGYSIDLQLCRDNTCSGTYGSVKIYNPNSGGGEKLALKSFILEKGPNGRFGQCWFDINTLNEQFKESVMQYKVKLGAEYQSTGSQYISEIKQVLVNLPTRDFLGNMMIKCLNTTDSIFFPSTIMEYAGGALTTYKGDATISSNRETFLKQIAEGLQFMNANNFFHQDIKPGNICVKHTNYGYTIKIIDFGLTKELPVAKAKESTQLEGSPAYMYLRNGRLDLCDIWAYILITIDFFLDFDEEQNTVVTLNYHINNNRKRANSKISDRARKSLLKKIDLAKEDLCLQIVNYFKRDENPILNRLLDSITGGGDPYLQNKSIFYENLKKSPSQCECSEMWRSILECFQ